MTRETVTAEIIKCDRCYTTQQYDTNKGQAPIAKWSSWYGQGNNPTNIINIGDCYKFDLCPNCTKEITTWINNYVNAVAVAPK